MKKSDGSERIRFPYLVHQMRSGTRWEELDYAFQAAFNKYFLEDSYFRKLCDVIYHNYEFYQELEGLWFERLSEGKMSSMEDCSSAYRFIQKRQLWNPFQVLYGRRFIIFPYDEIDSSCFESDSFFTLNKTGDDKESLIKGVQVARLLKSIIDEPNHLGGPRLDVQKNKWLSFGSYRLHFDRVKDKLIIEYGLAGTCHTDLDIKTLFSTICEKLDTYRQFVKRAFPYYSAMEIIETIRLDHCLTKLPLTIRKATAPTYSYWFPYEFSMSLLRNYETTGNGIPFRVRTTTELPSEDQYYSN